MSQSLAFEIGALFLLAALLIGGSSERLLHARFRLGPGTLAFAGIVIAIFALYRYGGELWTWFLPAPEISRATVTAARKTASPQAIAPPKPTKAASATHWKTIVVETETVADAQAKVLPPGEPQKSASDPVPPDSGAPDPCEKSQYQSKIKRALKSVGCTMHIIPRK